MGPYSKWQLDLTVATRAKNFLSTTSHHERERSLYQWAYPHPNAMQNSCALGNPYSKKTAPSNVTYNRHMQPIGSAEPLSRSATNFTSLQCTHSCTNCNKKNKNKKYHNENLPVSLSHNISNLLRQF